LVFAAGVKLTDITAGSAADGELTLTLADGLQVAVQGAASYQFSEGLYSQSQVADFLVALTAPPAPAPSPAPSPAPNPPPAATLHTTNIFDANGTLVGDSWIKDDGTLGFDQFNADGSSLESIYYTDGSHSDTYDDGHGYAATFTTSAQLEPIAASVTETNGLNKITSFLNGVEGVKTSETWIHADGRAANDVISPLDFNGLSNLAALSRRDLDGGVQWTAPDGAWESETGYGPLFEYGNAWLTPAVDGRTTAHGFRNVIVRNGILQNENDQTWFGSDQGGPGSFDMELYLATPEFAAQDTPYQHHGQNFQLLGAYDMYDFTSKLEFQGIESADGTKFLFAAMQGTNTDGPFTQITTTPLNATTLTFQSDNGDVDILKDDGLGNLLITGYTASGQRYGDMWFHNDGSNGADDFNADGSSTGVISNPEGSFVSFSKDAQGHVVQVEYPGVQVVPPHLPGNPAPFLAPPPAPAQYLSAPSGQQHTVPGVSTTGSTSGGEVVITVSDWSGKQTASHVDVQGNVVWFFEADTDPGYSASVTVAGGTLAWNYDAAGLPISRSRDDALGGKEVWTYDSYGRLAGRSLATTSADGAVTTMVFGVGGEVVASSVETHPSVGRSDTDRFDPAGHKRGKSIEVTDGAGNTVLSDYDAAGTLMSSTTTVATSANGSTMTRYTGQGAATQMVVTNTSPDGVITTSTYDGAGNLQSTVVATRAAPGNVYAANYDASGLLISYVTVDHGDDAAIHTTTHDNQGRITREDVLKATGEHVTSVYSLDGSSASTTTRLDGTYTTAERNGLGDVITAEYSSEGSKLSDSWQRGDGTRGTDVFNADGSSLGQKSYRDGTTSTTIGDRAGHLTTTHYGADGSVIDSALTTRTTRETRTETYDSLGQKMGDSWVRKDGSNGTDTFFSDGSGFGTTIEADGTHVDYNDDGLGNRETITSDAQGVVLSDITAHAGNQPPHAAGLIEAQTATEELAWTFTIPAGAFVDPDSGDALSYQSSLANGDPLPAWLHFDPATRTFIGTPLNADVGVLSLSVLATDPQGASASVSFDLTIANVNDAPVLFQVVADQVAKLNEPWSFALPANTFTDADAGDILALSASQDGGSALPSWLSFDAATGTFSGTPAPGTAATLRLSVVATDLAGATANGTFALSITGANSVPVAVQPISDQAVTEDQPWSFSIAADAFADANADEILSYGASLADGSALPAWVSFNAATRTFSGTPGNGEVGSLNLKVTATDSGGASASSSFSVTVVNANNAPVSTHAISAQSVSQDQHWTFTVPADAFTDVDAGDSLSYSVTLADGSSLPSWLGFDALTQTFGGTPSNTDVGSLTIKVIATDGSGASASANFGLQVLNVNDAPVAAQGLSSQTILTAKAWTFTIPSNTFYDADIGDILTYSATLADGSGLPSWLRFDVTTRTFSGTPGIVDAGAISLSVIVTDAAGASASQSFNLDVSPTPGQIITGTSAPNTLTGGAGPDRIDGLGGADTMRGGDGDDTYVVDNAKDLIFEDANQGYDRIESSVTYTLAVNVEAIALTGTASINATGNAQDNELVGNSGNNKLDGGTGADRMAGGLGNDTYTVDNAGDLVTELAGEGTDTVQALIDYTLTSNVENLTLLGTASIVGTGNELNNVITANASGSVLRGLGGNDTLRGGTGADTLYGGEGNDRLDGGASADLMAGGAGNDTYIVDDAGDVTVELAGEGTDTVQSSVNLVLAANIENLTLTGTSALTGAGNGGNNVLIANAAGDVLRGMAGNDTLRGGAGADVLSGGDGNDHLDGGSGADQMFGGAGNDSYVIDDVGDQVTELANEGTDLVESAISYTLGANLENLTLTGTGSLLGVGNELGNLIIAGPGGNIIRGLAGNDTLRGGVANDTLEGGEGDDRLDGGAGSDQMTGGTGNDLYIVDAAGDVVIELANEGVDTVQSSISYTLGAELENLALTGAGVLVGTGNAAANILTSNASGSTLWGLSGDDTLLGGAGADTLNGGDGNDRLDGKGGADQMTGGAGNDIYIVDAAGDLVVELDGEGTDTVQSSVSYTLTANVENLTLTGTGAINGTGNDLNNTIIGNGAANRLRGLGGNDTLNGGAANDTLEGGTGDDRLNGGLGADTYLFGRGDGQDTLVDVDATAGVQDVLRFGSGIAADQLWLRKVGSNLEVSVIGTTDKVTISGWYTDAAHHVEVMQLANGKQLLDSQVQNLVQAMASFAPPPAGQTSLSPSYHTSLDTVIAANWQ
jgi:YD repeat-containing protein